MNIRDTCLDPEGNGRSLRQVEREGHVDDFEGRIHKKDGSKGMWLSTSSMRRPQDRAILGSQHITRDITERNSAEEMERELRAISEIAGTVGSNLDIGQVYDSFAEELKALVPLDTVAVVLADANEGVFWLEHVYGLPTTFQQGVRYPLRGSVIEHMMKTGEAVISHDTRRDRRFWACKEFAKAGRRSFIQAPLKAREKVFGAVGVLHREPDTYGEREVRLVKSLASQIAPAIENARMFQRLKQSQEEARAMALFAMANPSPVIRFDRKGLLLYFNPAARAVLGEGSEKGADVVSLLPALGEVDLEQCIAEAQSITLEADIGAQHFQFLVKGLPDLGVGHVYASDITELRRAEETERELTAVGEVARIVGSSLELEEVYDHFARELRRLVPLDRLSLIFIDQEESTWSVAYTYGGGSTFGKGKPYSLAGSFTEHMLMRGETVVSDDVSQDDRFWTFKVFAESGFRSFANTPVRSKNKVFAAVSLFHREAGVYGDREMHLLESLAAQIAPAIENSQLFQEVSQARDSERLRSHELNALFAIATILTGKEGFEAKVARTLEELTRISQSASATLRVPGSKNRELHILVTVGRSFGRADSVPVKGTFFGKAFRTGKSVVVNDYHKNPRAIQEFVEQGLESVVLLPIKVGDQVLGVMSVDSSEAQHFTPERVRLLASVADGLGPFLESARLTHELGSALLQNRHQMEGFRQAADLQSLAAEPGTALQDLLDLGRELVQAEYGALAVWQRGTESAEFILSGMTPEQRERIRTPPQGLGLLRSVRSGGEVLRLADISTHPESHGFLTSHPPMKTFLGVPISYGGQSDGALYFTEKEGGAEFTEDDERLMNVLAALTGALLSNSRLYQEVIQERATLSAIQASMVEGLVVLDTNERIIYRNGVMESFTGLPNEVVMGKSVEEFVLLGQDGRIEPSKSVDSWKRLLRASMEKSASMELEVERPTHRNLEVTAFPILSRTDGRMTGLLFRDVTRERDLERRRDSFVSVASHELRTPMTGIMGFSELLLTQYVPAVTRRKWLKHINLESQRLTAILEDLLDVSRIQSGKLTPLLETLSVRDAIAEVIAILGATTDKHDLQVKLPSRLPKVIADRDKLTQVLTNLLDNAIKYSPQGGRITISARHQRGCGRVLVGVADEGIGISLEDREEIFTTFSRIRRPETASIGGTGLGLYIVRELLTLMNGEVWVESEPGVGSTFFFTLPAA